MKLFAVKLSSGALLTNNNGQVAYYEDKKEAKRNRDKYDGAVVVLGPDHDRYTE